MNITYSEFKAAYTKFKPNKVQKFITDNLVDKTDKKIGKILSLIALSLVLFGIIGAALNVHRNILIISTLAFGIAFGIIYISYITATLLNNLLIRKRRKELGGISRREYEELLYKYGIYLLLNIK